MELVAELRSMSMQDDTAEKRGYLKVSKNVSDSCPLPEEQVWCVFTGGVFRYYKDSKSTTPLGSIEWDATAHANKGENHTLTLSKGELVLVLEADSDSQLGEWLDTISAGRLPKTMGPPATFSPPTDDIKPRLPPSGRRVPKPLDNNLLGRMPSSKPPHPSPAATPVSARRTRQRHSGPFSAADQAHEILDQMGTQLGDEWASKIAYVRRVLTLPSWEQALPADFQRTGSSSSSASASSHRSPIDRKPVNELPLHFSSPPATPEHTSPSHTFLEQYSRVHMSPSHSAYQVRRQSHRPDPISLARRLIHARLPPHEVTEKQKEQGSPQARAVDAALDNIDSLDFDVIQLSRITEGKPLQAVLKSVMASYGLLETFSIDYDTFKNFAQVLESRYRPVPYHNSEHAADVLQTTHCFIKSGLEAILSPLEILALLLAAACHDVDHNGVNNGFHIKSSSAIAIAHNDRSVLENHHCCTAWHLLAMNSSTAILSCLPARDKEVFRNLFLHLILGTDMQLHLELLQRMKAIIGTRGPELSSDWEGDERLTLLKFVLHAADISNPTKSRELNQEWGSRCLCEFFGQGDHERSLNIPVTFDRDTWNIAEGQLGFFKFAAEPTFEIMGELMPALEPCIAAVAMNSKYWEDVRDGKETYTLPTTTYELATLLPPGPHQPASLTPFDYSAPVTPKYLLSPGHSEHSGSSIPPYVPNDLRSSPIPPLTSIVAGTSLSQ
mmetsp:Transcript_18794/g.44008  ORF Transcript_18794/g.44008 Transcript_18794/m.44008 type:complete len:725 (+) Transcript_18794:26-2200(+)